MVTTSNFKYLDKIDEWAKKNSKLKTIEELTVLKKYLVFNGFKETELRLSSDYTFEYYPNDLIEIKKLKSRPENVFKLSITQILNKFKKYFQTQIDFEIFFEKPNELEAKNEGKQQKYCARPDIQITLSKANSDDKKLLIIEYNEKGSHDPVYDSYKDIKAISNSFMFYKYEESNEQVNNLNFSNTIKNIIMDMFCIVCTILDNRFILSKIIFFENFSHLNNEELKTKTDIFNYICKVSIDKTFDLKKLYLELRPYNLEGSSYTWEEFIKLLKSKYKINLNPDIKQKNFDSKYFPMIINCLDTNISENILEYKQIYTESINALEKASEKIIYFINKQINKMHYSKKYLENYVEFDLINSGDIGILTKLSEKLNIKFANT